MVLPNSRWVARYSVRFYRFVGGEGNLIRPDREIAETWADFQAGRDPVMDWVLENALPLVITHGWPGSSIEQMKIIDPLTNPTVHGGSASDAPSIQPASSLPCSTREMTIGRPRSIHRGAPGRSDLSQAESRL